MGYRDDYFNNNPSNHGWYTCAKCGRKLRRGDADIDHIFPQSCGGWDAEDNLQCLCKRCNRSKRNDMSDVMDDYRRKNKKGSFEFHDWFGDFDDDGIE